MKNADMPSMPMFCNEAKPCRVRDPETGEISLAYGLTKREMFAMHFMGSCRVGRNYSSWEDMANDAIDMADALLLALEQQK